MYLILVNCPSVLKDTKGLIQVWNLKAIRILAPVNFPNSRDTISLKIWFY